MFSGFRNTLGLMQMNSDVGMTGKSKMAAIYWKCICHNGHMIAT